ncbi:MAG: archease [Acidobacteria bacterium]|nr:archease [Acidobacteriota bacterium]
MPYRYLDDVAIADAAFEAWGESLQEMLTAAADALLNVMISNIDAVRLRVTRHVRIEEDAIDMLLFQLLQELVYYKDSERLLLRIRSARIEQQDTGVVAFVEFAGETIDPARHHMVVDVKAVTLHRLKAEERDGTWWGTVVVDV